MSLNHSFSELVSKPTEKENKISFCISLKRALNTYECFCRVFRKTLVSLSQNLAIQLK